MTSLGKSHAGEDDDGGDEVGASAAEEERGAVPHDATCWPVFLLG